MKQYSTLFKILILFTTVILLIALSACDSGNAPAESTKDPSVTTDPAPTSNEGTTEGSPAESISEPPEETTAGEPVKADWLPAEAAIDNRGLLLYATFPSSYQKDAPIVGTLTLKNTTDAPLSLYLRVYIGISEYLDLMGDGSAPSETLIFSDTKESIDSQETYLPVSLGIGEELTVDFSIPTDQDTFASDIDYFFFTVGLYESETAQTPVYAFCFPILGSYAQSKYH